MPNFDTDKNWLSWYLGGMVLFVGMCWMGMAILMSLLFVRSLWNIILWSLDSCKLLLFFHNGFLIWIHHSWFAFVASLNGVLTFGFILTYLFYITVVFTKELLLGMKQSKYRILNKSRNKTENLRHIYWGFRILNANTTCYFGKFVTFNHALIIITPVWCMFVLFLYWNILSILTKGPMILGSPPNMGFWTLVLKYLFVGSYKIMVS